MSERVRVLVCDDQEIMRVQAGRILQAAGSFEVVGEAPDAATGISMAIALRPAVVLMDVRLPDIPGSEATRRILAAAPLLKVLAYSSENHWLVVEEMFSAGAMGYVLKTANNTELLHGIQTVLRGGFFISPGVKRVG